MSLEISLEKVWKSMEFWNSKCVGTLSSAPGYDFPMISHLSIVVFFFFYKSHLESVDL